MNRHYFHCDDCDDWTEADHLACSGDPVCSNCGEPYHCNECGYDIDQHGKCQRPEGHPERCIRCGGALTPNDPVVTTLGPRCAQCWTAR